MSTNKSSLPSKMKDAQYVRREYLSLNTKFCLSLSSQLLSHEQRNEKKKRRPVKTAARAGKWLPVPNTAFGTATIWEAPDFRVCGVENSVLRMAQ